MSNPVERYMVSGEYYHLDKEKMETFTGEVSGSGMSEGGARSEARSKFGGGRTSNFKIHSLTRKDSADNSTIPVGVNDGTVPAPRSDGETARAEKVMRSDVISKVCDAAIRVSDRCMKYMDSVEARSDAEESPGSKREHALVEARGKVSRLQKQLEDMAAEKGEAIKTELEAAKETLAQLEGGAVDKDDKVSIASAEDKAKDSKSVKDSLAEARSHLVSLQGSRVNKNSSGPSRSGNPVD